MTRRRTIYVLLFIAVLSGGPVSAQGTAVPREAERQSLDEAWWTGPIVANSAGTLKRGHFLIEPYFYDVKGTHSSHFGSSAYVLYGLVDRLTIGFIPVVGYNKVSNGPSSSGLGLGDIGAIAQFRISKFHEGHWFPATAFQVQETFPTGKYDRLGDRPSDGQGNGAFATTLALNSQRYFWMPNGRILRMRLDASETFSKEVQLADVSVYGTGTGFRGHAKPGSSFFLDAAWEYSLTKNWVLALDATYRHGGNTRVTGFNIFDSKNVMNPSIIRQDSGSSDGFGIVPAFEYNWNSNLGVILGTRFILSGHNTTSSVTPVIAINFVH